MFKTRHENGSTNGGCGSLLVVLCIIALLAIPATIKSIENDHILREVQTKHPEVKSIDEIERHTTAFFLVTVKNKDGTESATMVSANGISSNELVRDELAKHPDAFVTVEYKPEVGYYMVFVWNSDGTKSAHRLERK